jgi:phage virion morphogenesis protein
MAGVGLTYDLSGVAMLQRRVEAIGKFERRRLLDEIGATVESQTRRRIEDDKADPEGKAWPAWSDRYAKNRHGNQSLLESKGMLIGSLGYAVALAGDQVEVGSNLIYAATHQFGDPKRNIPARPYLGLSGEDEAELEEVIDNFLRRVAP